MPSLPAIPLPPGIRSRFVENINGLRIHVLEAGFETKGRPCVLLLHGFPELAYSWRKVMPALAEAGYHVIAPDQRGYGRTTGWDADYDGDLVSFRLLNLVRDALGLVSTFGYRSVDAVVGHDFGGSVAAWCALVRPDLFRSVALMSAPFAGPPPLHSIPSMRRRGRSRTIPCIASLRPCRGRASIINGTTRRAQANADMHHAPQGVHDFLRAYYHHKSADWKGNAPYPLKSWTASELAKLPTYYVMDLAKNMAETVAEEMPDAAAVAGNKWLPDNDLAFYSAEYARTGFQGGLQWYRCGTSGAFNSELETFSGRTIDVPSCFISGRQDWGTYQRPGVFEAMQSSACTQMIGCHLVEGAGHWVQQEQPQSVTRLLLQFLKQAAERAA